MKKVTKAQKAQVENYFKKEDANVARIEFNDEHWDKNGFNYVTTYDKDGNPIEDYSIGLEEDGTMSCCDLPDCKAIVPIE
jgi:hypothetical protein